MENTLDLAWERRKPSEPPAFCQWNSLAGGPFAFKLLFFIILRGIYLAKKSNLIPTLGGIICVLQPEDKKWSFVPRLRQWSQISLKSVAVFKEQSSGKLVEPAGNQIQADPPPPHPSAAAAPLHHVMIRLQSSPSLLQVLLSVKAGPGKISMENRGCLRKKKRIQPQILFLCRV